MISVKEKLKEKVKLLPNLPGSYQFIDENGKVLYIGKAKNLKKRVSSYFTGSHDAKTTHLLMEINDFEYIVTDSELDALLLELNLIKKYNPRYNIMLTDDKTYPYIEITDDRHPKLIITRTKKSANINRFGPYPNVKAARETVQILNKIYPLRKCMTLPKETCLYYHIGQCLAPCIKDVPKGKYNEIKREIRQFLKGDIKQTINYLEKSMNLASEKLEFEKANEYKKLIEAVKTTTKRQKININDDISRDIIGYYTVENFCAIEIFFVRNGQINTRYHKVFEIHDDLVASLENFIAFFYQKHPLPKELLLPESIKKTILPEILTTKILYPQKGIKKDLINLTTLNAEKYLHEKLDLFKKEQEKTIKAVEKLGELLNIKTPFIIEAFDNSNIFGEHAVSAMVVFTNGKPNKQKYRKYKIKYTQKTNSDIDMMKEVLYRRYYRVLMEGLEKPDLIILDGSLQQLNAAKEVLSSLNLSIPCASIVKDKKHQTSYLLSQTNEKIYLKTTNNVFQLLTKIQDEMHRFAITYHKNIRSKSLFNSKLDKIPYIGERTKKLLLMHFKNTKAIQNASINQLKELGLNQNQIDNLLTALKNGDFNE